MTICRNYIRSVKPCRRFKSPLLLSYRELFGAATFHLRGIWCQTAELFIGLFLGLLLGLFLGLLLGLLLGLFLGLLLKGRKILLSAETQINI